VVETRPGSLAAKLSPGSSEKASYVRILKGKQEPMKEFPEFILQPANRVASAPDASMQGFVFEGAEGTQIVFWRCQKGGEVAEHVHDFWEYCLVVEGTFDGLIEGEPIHLEAGDECTIPPGAKHSGRFSHGYRAIDAFGGKRVGRVLEISRSTVSTASLDAKP